MMKCNVCRSKTVPVTTKEVFYGNIVIDNIKAHKCEKCGELYFDEATYDKTLKKVREIKQKIPMPLMSRIKLLVA